MAAEGEEEGRRQPVQEIPELRVLRLGVRPGQARLRSQPGPGGADHPAPDRLAPAPEGAPGHRRTVTAGLPGPVVGGRDTVAGDVDAGLEDRRQGEAAPPQLGREKRHGPAGAETDPQDRDSPRHLAGREVEDALALTPTMATDAPGVPTPGTADAGLRGEVAQRIVAGCDRGDVVRKWRTK